jgi:hypothetical protein
LAAAKIEAHEYETEVLNQWIAPLISIASIASMACDIVIGVCLVLLEDYTKWKFIDSEHTNFISLLLSVTIGFQIGEHKKRYDDTVENFGIITCNDSGIDEAQIKKGVISFILATPVGSVMTPNEFNQIYMGIQSTTYTLAEKYKAYRAICNTVAQSQTRTLSTLIWWHINLLCAVMVPSSLNDNETHGDFGWLVAAVLIMVVAWSTYGAMVQYSDVLRPTRIWIYRSLAPTVKTRRPRGLIEGLSTVF